MRLILCFHYAMYSTIVSVALLWSFIIQIMYSGVGNSLRKPPLKVRKYLVNIHSYDRNRTHPVFSRVRVTWFLVLCVMLCRSLVVFFLLPSELSVLRLMGSDNPFGIFNHFSLELMHHWRKSDYYRIWITLTIELLDSFVLFKLVITKNI